MFVGRRTFVQWAALSAGRAVFARVVAPGAPGAPRGLRGLGRVGALDRFGALAAGVPAEVLIVRHAEQPTHGSQVHLSTIGRARAAALPSLFPVRFPTPTVLFATRASKESNRPVETLQPLAQALGLRIDDRFPDEACAQLASTILTGAGYAGAHILICWHHGTIPALAAQLGAVHAPARWPDAQYDHVWQLRYGAGGVRFEDRQAPLLPSDRGGEDPATGPPRC
jgi:broad specificity phosphatase PhoE